MVKDGYARVRALLEHKYPNAYHKGTYTDYDTGDTIWIADWNPVSKTVIGAIERLGIQIAWCDEYVTDGNGDAHRSSPTHWGWIPSFIVWNGEVYPKHECVEDLEWYVDYLLDERKGDIFGLNFSAQGFTKVEPEYESGFYGVDDNADEIRDKLEKAGFDVILSLTNQEQFSQTFVVWTRKQEATQ